MEAWIAAHWMVLTIVGGVLVLYELYRIESVILRSLDVNYEIREWMKATSVDVRAIREGNKPEYDDLQSSGQHPSADRTTFSSRL